MSATHKKRSRFRRILKYALVSLGVLFLMLLLLPVLFRPQIIAFAKKQLNRQLTAKVDFDDVRISLLRNFPRLDLKFENLTIAGTEGFSNDTLLIAPAAHVVTNFKTLFRSDVEVYAIELDEPDIRARVDSNGRQNFDIIRTTGSATDNDTSAADFSLALKRYEIRNGKLSYHDDQARVYTVMKHFDHEGSGDFTDVRFKMDTETRADSVDFRFGEISYLSGAVVDLPVELDIDNGNRVYVFSTEEFFVNSVPLASKGTIRSVNDSVDNVDITVKTKRSDFKNILTLIPGIYTRDLNDFETRGTAVIDGRVYGHSSARRSPNFDVKIDVADGYLKNPGFPETLSAIHLDGRIVNTGGVSDSTVITMKNGRALVGAEPLQFELAISRPVTAMFIDLAAKGNVQLEKLKNILKTGSTEIRGSVHADLRASGPLRAFQQKEADAIRASGFLNANNFYYKDPSTLPFTASVLKMQFDRSEAHLDLTNGSYNNTTINATGTIFNFFNFLFVNSPLRGKINASTPELNLAHWASNNTVSTATPATSKPFIVPASLMLDINAHADKLITERVTLNAIDGRILFGGRKILLENIKAKGFGGDLEVDGSYSSEKTPLQPDITLNYKIRNFDVRQTFKAFITAKSLMPIGEYLSGTLSSELSAAGKLGDDFMPVMNSLNGNGNLLLLNGLLEKFKPLERIAERLDIDRLRNIATKEIRNRFSFENGLVNVLPFKFTIFDNYDFEVAGKHGFDNSMDYAVKLSLPRKDLGPKGQLLYQTLNSQLGKIGINIKPSEKVSFFIRLTGTVSSPDVDIQLDKTLGNEFDVLKEQAEEQIKSKLDSAKNVVKDSVKKIKDQIITGVKDKILGKDTTGQKPKDSSSKKKQVIKSVIDIFTNRNKKDSI